MCKNIYTVYSICCTHKHCEFCESSPFATGSIHCSVLTSATGILSLFSFQVLYILFTAGASLQITLLMDDINQPIKLYFAVFSVNLVNYMFILVALCNNYQICVNDGQKKNIRLPSFFFLYAKHIHLKHFTYSKCTVYLYCNLKFNAISQHIFFYADQISIHPNHIKPCNPLDPKTFNQQVSTQFLFTFSKCSLLCILYSHFAL